MKTFSKLILILTLFTVQVAMPGITQAAGIDITSSGCFVRVQNDNYYTVRMQSPSCILTVDNSGDASSINIIVENIDPDYVTVSSYDSLAKSENSMQFAYTAANGNSTINIQPWHQYEDEFYFIALADNQPKGTIEVNPVFEQMVRDINQLQPVFYTNSGDLIQGSSSIDTVDAMYQELIDFLSTDNLAPMYPIAGNHDAISGTSKFEEYFGVDNYSFDFANTHFSGLSTVITNKSKGGATDDDLAWLLNDLQASTKTHKLAFFHHPLVAPEWGNSTCCYLDLTERDALAQVLDQQNIHTIITGHAHGYDYRYLDNASVSTINSGFYQLITGGAGGNLAQPDGKHHFVIMHVTPEDVTHTVVNQTDFATFVEYQNNDGTQSMPTANVVNEDDQDIPYVRLKFKINSDFDSYVVYDNQGNYYDTFYHHTFDDYTVLYAEVQAPADSDTIYTAAPATVLQEDNVNTVKFTGEVIYKTYPTATETTSGLTAVPKTKHTKISKLTWGDETNNYVSKWKEEPTSKKLNTLYTFSNLPANQQFTVKVNNSFYTRFTANEEGVAQFQYTKNQRTRNFVVHPVETLHPYTFTTIPSSKGSAHVLTFNKELETLRSWFAFDSSQAGNYNILQKDVTGDWLSEYIVFSQGDTTAKLGIYSEYGDHIKSLSPYSASVKGLQVYVANLNGVAQPEIVVAAENGSSQIKVYRYTAEGKLKKQMVLQPFGKDFKGTIKLLVKDLNTDGKSEIIVASKSSDKPMVKVYGQDKKKLKLLSEASLPNNYEQVSLAAGDMNANGKLELVVVTSKDNKENVHIYNLVKGKLNEIINQPLDTKLQGNRAVLLADIDTSNRAVFMLTADDSSPVYGYQLNSKNELEKQFAKRPFGKSNVGPTALSVVNLDQVGDAELVTTNSNKVRIWNYKSSKKKLFKKKDWQPYGSAFNGGIHVAQ